MRGGSVVWEDARPADGWDGFSSSGLVAGSACYGSLGPDDFEKVTHQRLPFGRETSWMPIGKGRAGNRVAIGEGRPKMAAGGDGRPGPEPPGLDQI